MPIIKNKRELAVTKLRKQALEIIEAGIESVMPVDLMRSAVKYNAKQKILTVQNKKYDLKNSRIFIIGGGKAAELMAKELEIIIGVKNITDGIVNCNSKTCKTKKIKIVKASHPVPNQSGVKGAREMLALKEQYSINKNDFVICLISGGGSALMLYPVDGVSLEDKQKVTKLLISSGAKIQEINIVRKHLSKIKGGQLGKFFAPTTIISLIISDVVGDDLKTIASGPTVPDSSTFKDAYNILKKYKLLSKAPKSAIKYLKKGYQGKAGETPRVLNNCHNYIIGDNKLALRAMSKRAKELKLKPIVVTAEQSGDPAEVAKKRAKEIICGKYKNYNTILIGGETTPKLPQKAGKGGRNQHYAAASILAMKKYNKYWAVASINTDGSDYLSNTAGAIIDNNSLNLVESKGINVKLYLDKYNSNTLLKKINKSFIITGNTGTNVGDIIMYILD